MIEFHVELGSINATKHFGNLLGQIAQAGDVYCFDGNLGVGKTTIIQAIALALEVPADTYVTSPSFAILHEYQGRIPLYHMDFYRLKGRDDILDMGLDEYFYAAGLTAIEWAGKATGILPENSLYISLSMDAAGARTAVCRYHDEKCWQDRIYLLVKHFSIGQ